MNLALLTNSLAVAVATTVLAVPLGAVAAFGVAGRGRTARITSVAAAIAVLALPPFMVVNAWLGCFGASGPLQSWLPFPLFSPVAAVAIMTLMFWPIPFLILLGVWQRLTSDLLDSEPALRGLALIRWLLIPAARPAATVALAITFVLALNQFTVPALLQVKVYPAEVWVRFNSGLDTLGALTLSWPMILAPAALLWFAWRREIAWPRRTSGLQPTLFRRRAGRGWIAGAGLVLVVMLALSLVLPSAQLLLSPGTWRELGPAFRAGTGAVSHSVLLASATATLVVLAALATAHQPRAAGLWLIFLLPGVVLGVGMIVVFNRPWLSALYHSVGIVTLAWGLRYFAPAWALARHARGSIDSSLTDLLRLEGADPWQRFRLLTWPQAGGFLCAAWYLVYLLCLWDTETLVLIMPPAGETLALRIFNFLHYGHTAQVNALCLILLGLALLPLALYQLLRAVTRALPVRPTSSPLWAALTCAWLLPGCTPADPSTAPIPSRLFAQAQVIGERGNGPGQFQKPRSVTVDLADNLYVVDMTGRVQKFSPDGHYLSHWQMPQTDLGKPKGMCRDAAGRIVVLEPHYARVNHFTTEGALVEQWGERGTNLGQINFPRAVALAPDGRLAVSEYMQVERIQCFTPDHRLDRAIGHAGRANGEFNRAEGIAFDPAGRLYVADSCNHRIQVFDPDGTFLRTYGQPGTGTGEMSYPYDICVDPQGRQFVCEFGNSRIQVFDTDGRWFETLGGPGSAPGRFSNPWSLALDSHDNLYVADALNHRVQKLIRRTAKD